MKKKIYLLLILLLIPTFVSAKTKDYFYTNIGDSDIVENDVNGSSIVMGDTISINNNTQGVGAFMGNSIVYTGTSEYGLIMGNTISISGTIKDAVVMGNLINFNEESKIERDIIILGNNITLSGNYARDVRVYASSVKIDNANIDGDIYINAEKLNINKNTNISGELKINSNIDKNIKSSNINKISKYKQQEHKESILSKIMSYMFSWISYIVVFAVMVFVFPKLYEKIITKKEYGKIFGYGALLLIVLPIVGIFLLFSRVAGTLAIISFILYGISIYLSTIITGYYLGDYIWTKYINRVKTNYLVGVLGITILFVIQLIPYIGFLIKLISIIFTMGIIVQLIKNKKAVKK